MSRPSELKIRIFTKNVHAVTEWRDDSVYRSRPIGRVAYDPKNPPFRPGAGNFTVY